MLFEFDSTLYNTVTNTSLFPIIYWMQFFRSYKKDFCGRK